MFKKIFDTVGAVGGFVANNQSNKAQERQNRENNAFIDQQNKANRDFQMDMWNKTNEYNTPSQQMQRFKEAGLNPNLMYGQGTSGVTTAPQAPEQHVKRNEYQTQNAFQVAQQYLANRLQSAQISQMDKNKAKMDAEIESQKASADNLRALSAKALGELQTITQDYELKRDLVPVIKRQADATLTNTNILGDKMNQEIQNLIQANSESKSRIGLNSSQINLNDATIKKYAQDIQQSAAQISLMKTQGRMNEAKTELDKLYKRMYEDGQNPHDPVWQRTILDVANKFGFQDIVDGASNIGKSTLKYLKNRFYKPQY